ncbi:hypothetical protein ACGGAI_23800 [Streptomyces antibioticus]|uniref:hypothetical protein n=1 Tax=Streptomyces antibioticus TaxID=1890 RepID=UPI003722BC68
MTLNPFRRNRRNQEPQPVRPESRGPARGTGDAAPPLRDDTVAVLARELEQARTEAARWKRHADSYDEERALAVAAYEEGRREVEQARKERDSAYGERAQLLAWLAALHPSTTVITASPDVDEDGWQLLYLVAGGWQMSWHIHPRDAGLFRHVTVVDVTDRRAQWDGHGTVQKYERMRNHVRLLALDTVADGPSPDVAPEPRSA